MLTRRPTAQTQAEAQTAQMRALAAQGIADATALSAQLESIKREAAAAAKEAASARADAEESATARAEDLAKRHAEAMARLEFVMSASNNAMSAEVRPSAELRSLVQALTRSRAPRRCSAAPRKRSRRCSSRRRRSWRCVDAPTPHPLPQC